MANANNEREKKIIKILAKLAIEIIIGVVLAIIVSKYRHMINFPTII